MAGKWNDDPALVSALAGNLYEALPLLPKRLVRVDQLTREFDMPFSNIQILCILSEHSLTIGELSTCLGIAKPNITPLLDALKARGLLERIRSDRDRRIVNVALTPEGVAMADRLREGISRQVMQWPENISRSEIKRVNNALATLISFSAVFADDK